jgi:hypothetical protein
MSSAHKNINPRIVVKLKKSKEKKKRRRKKEIEKFEVKK